MICARLPSVCVVPLAVEIGVARNASTRVDRVLRRLHGNQVLHAALGSIQNDGATWPLDDSDTSTSFATSFSASPDCCAIVRLIVDLELGHARLLREVHVGRAAAPCGRASASCSANACESVLAADRTDDLQIDRRREPEVEHLRRDVGREEEEVGVRIRREQRRADPAHVRRRRRVTGLERDQDLRVRPARSARLR